ncbi:MAG: PASTA domain-containing protein [Fibrobacterales bacterium]
MNKKVAQDIAFGTGFWSIIIVIGFVLINSIIMPYISGQYKETVIVPDVTDLTADEAEALLVSKGLNFSWQSEGQYSATITKGSVMLQTPIANKVVKENRTISLKVSKGLREVIIPELRGKSRRQAEISLHQLGLKIGEAVRSSHSLIPWGVIIRTEPASKSLITIGSQVNLVISAARKSGTRVLPNVVGLSYHKAEQILDSLEFTIGDTTMVSDTTKLPLTILNQQPRSGEYLKKNTQIHLTIAQ